MDIPLDMYREGSAPKVQAHAHQQRVEAAKQPEAPLPGAEQKEFKPQILNSAAADMERISLVFNRKLQFVVDHHSNEVTVKVIDKETDKVIKELPPEELQRMHNNLRETFGFLFDERV
jgi:flagellar protein FlaG